MPSFTVEVEFEAYCSECGAGICNSVDTGDDSGYVRGKYVRTRHIEVQPCEKCIGELRDRIEQLEADLADAQERAKE